MLVYWRVTNKRTYIEVIGETYIYLYIYIFRAYNLKKYVHIYLYIYTYMDPYISRGQTTAQIIRQPYFRRYGRVGIGGSRYISMENTILILIKM